MQSVSYNGSGYDIPDNGDRTWSDLTAYLVALASGSLVKAGGSFVLTNDVNFGSSKGLIAKYFTSVTAGAASTGAVRLANTDSISFRNSLNTLDLPLSLSTNTLQFNSLTLALLASTLTASRALASDASGNLVSSATTATELGYMSGVTSAVQTQINTNSTNISTNLTTLTNHTGASTGVHGVTGAVVGTTDSQTLSTKTLTTPQINGLKRAVTTKTTTYTATLTDDLILCNPAASFTVTLPAAASSTGKVLEIKKIDSDISKLVTVAANGGELIDGSNTTKLCTQYERLVITCDGTGWQIDSRDYQKAWTSFTPTGSWVSNTTYTGFYRRIGDSIEVRVHVAATGSPSATSLTVNIPNSATWTIDTAKLFANSQAPLGIGKVIKAASDNFAALAFYSTTTAVGVQYLAYPGSAPIDTPSVAQTAPFNFANLDTVEVIFTVPITNFS